VGYDLVAGRFGDSLSVPSSKAKHLKTFENGTVRLPKPR